MIGCEWEYEECLDCDGTGYVDEDGNDEVCDYCGGDGEVEV